MTDEDGFLRKLLENPADDTTRLVYADWLEERGTEEATRKAEFLRLTCRLLTESGDRKKKKPIRKRLQTLAADLDTDWLAVVSRLKVENCARKRGEGGYRGAHFHLHFEFVCDRRWDEMHPTQDRATRFCDGCQEHVHYCDSITAARDHAVRHHCVAVDLGIIRREGDLAPDMRLMIMGRPGPDFYRQEEERLKPDPVSAAREQRKLDQSGERAAEG